MEEGSEATLTITNSLGTTVQHQSLSAALTKLNVKSLPPGIYYIRLTSAGSSVVKRFVKQ